MSRGRIALSFVLLLACGAGAGVGADGDMVLVSGRVILPERFARLPIQGGRLELSSVSGAHRERIRVADDRTYTAHLVPGERYVVRVHRIFVGRNRVSGAEFTVEPGTIHVPATGPPPAIDLRVRLNGGDEVVDIEVTTTGGGPAPGARVALFGCDERDRPSVPYGTAETDIRGRARFTGVRAGRARARLLSPGPHARTEQTLGTRRISSRFTADFVAGREEPVRFVLRAAGALEVTVDAAGLATAPPVSLWTTEDERPVEARLTPDVAGGSPRYHFSSLEPRRYRVVVTYPDGRVVQREVDVVAGHTKPLLLSRERARAGGFEPVVRWSAFDPRVKRVACYLTPLCGDGQTIAYEAARGAGIRRRYGPAPGPGEYLLRHPDRRLARRLAIGPQTVGAVDVTPPRNGFLERGSRTVVVRVTRGGDELDDLFVGLRGRGGADVPGVEWMRYAATSKGVVRFACVPDGLYELHVVDRVLGVEHGVEEAPLRIEVEQDDLEVEWKLRDGAR